MAKAFENAVLPKITDAPLNADLRVETSSTSPLTISIPCATRAWLSARAGSRATPRIFHSGSLRKALATEPPYGFIIRNGLFGFVHCKSLTCTPVMPTMTISFAILTRDLIFV